MRIYPYRTTAEKIEQSVARVVESGDVVLSSHFVGGRDWVLICRSGEQTVADLTEAELVAAIRRGVADGMRDAERNAMRRMGVR